MNIGLPIINTREDLYKDVKKKFFQSIILGIIFKLSFMYFEYVEKSGLGVRSTFDLLVPVIMVILPFIVIFCIAYAAVLFLKMISMTLNSLYSVKLLDFVLYGLLVVFHSGVCAYLFILVQKLFKIQ